MYHDHRGSSDKSYQNNILILIALIVTLVYSRLMDRCIGTRILGCVWSSV